MTEPQNPDMFLGHKPNNEPFTFFTIDESAAMHKTLDDLISSFGGVVVGKAFDGIDAMYQLQTTSSPIDVITLDINLPSLNGMKLLPMLKAIIPSTKIVMVSAFSKTEAVKQTITLGADYFILKPFKPDHVFKIFNYVCHKEITTDFGQHKLRNSDRGPLGVLALANSEEHAKTTHTILDWYGCKILGVLTDPGETFVKNIEMNKRSLNVLIVDADASVEDFEELFSHAFRANALIKVIVLTSGATPEVIESFKTLQCYARLAFADDESLAEVLTGMFPLQ